MVWRQLFFWLLLFVCPAHSAANDYQRLINQGQVYLHQGQYYLAKDTFRTAQRIAITPEQLAVTEGALGITQYRMHNARQAEKLLRKAIDRSAGKPRERAIRMITLAVLLADRDLTIEARRLYAEALPLCGDDDTLRLKIRLGLADLMPSGKRFSELNNIFEAIAKLSVPEDKAAFFIHLSHQAQAFHQKGLALAYDSLVQAKRNAVHQPRLLAEAIGGLAQLYENQRRIDEAILLNRQAIQAAQTVDAHDLLLELEGRQGRLYRRLHNYPEAIRAYQNAVDHIEAIRPDIPVEYHNGRSSFRDTLEPIYLGLADMLLANASRADREEKTRLLRRARLTVELIKQSELEDFLGGRCTVQGVLSNLSDNVEVSTAVLYPIILPGRLELLVSIGNEIRQFTEAVDADTIGITTRRFANSLRNTANDEKVHAKKLYDWLIAPIEEELENNNVRTLVIVPDGVLRLVPLAALYDGKRYLIEKYALASSPGLTLSTASALANSNSKVLLAGLSVPGPVIEQLPTMVMEGLVRSTLTANERWGHSRAIPGGEPDNEAQDTKIRQAFVERGERDPHFVSKIKKQLTLPGVEKEINGIKQWQPGNTLLMNKAFTKDGFIRHVKQESYSIVHIASHGMFGNTAGNSFIMAYDGIINIDQLDKLLSSDKFKQQPVELLTLSACQTAEGDDRAPLGLSGVALKANVRSALGSLWPVDDAAAARLMPEFYKALRHPEMSKAQALRQAQLSLLNERQYRHPYFWAPFILVGNWL